MPLTPDDVRSKRFTPVRLREGYDMGEVDQFLDEVESELERLTAENGDLQSRLEAAGTWAPSSGDGTGSADDVVAAEPGPEPSKQAEPEPVVPEPVPQPPVPPTTIAAASGAAARLLEIAARNADEVVEDAKSQADTLLAEATTRSERLENDARGKADRVASDAQARAEKLDAEIAAKRSQMFGDLERDHETLTREVEHLRAFEREYRSRLKSYFAAQLAQLDGDDDASAPLPGSAADDPPERLKSLLGEEPIEG